MHYLQKAILDKLRYGQPLTYTALMPDGIESSHFRYHLKQLITDNLIIKNKQGNYFLSDKGQQEVDYLSNNRATAIRLPKVISYTLLTKDSQLLLYKKPKEPYRNLWSLIGGKIHFGEDTQQAAKREVFEKAGFTIPPPMLCGVANILTYHNDEPMSHVIAYVFTAELSEPPTQLPAELKLFNKTDLPAQTIPDLLEILMAISNGNFPFVQQIRCTFTDAAADEL